MIYDNYIGNPYPTVSRGYSVRHAIRYRGAIPIYKKINPINMIAVNPKIEEKLQEKISLATIYNTVHAFQKKGYIKKIPLDVNKSYYDTNVKDHHHFFDEDSHTLKDIDENKITIGTIPNSPINKKIKSIEVLIRLANAN